GGEGEIDVAGTVIAEPAGPGHAQRHAPRQPFQLMRKKRCIRGDHRDDRTLLLQRYRLDDTGLDEFAAGAAPADHQILPAAEVGLDEAAQCEGATGPGDDARGGAIAALEAKGDHARAAADAALLDRPASCRVERGSDMTGSQMLTIDVVEET